VIFKRILKALLRRGFLFINSHFKLRQCGVAVIQVLGLNTFARAFYWRLNCVADKSSTRRQYGYIPTDVAHLTPRARKIYADLKDTIGRRQKENA